MTMLANGRKARATTKAALAIPTAPAMVATMSEALGFTSIRDMAFQYSAHTDAEGKYIAYVRAVYPTMTDKDKVPKEFTDEFTAGCTLRHAELNPPVIYVREGEDTYRPRAEGETVADGKALALSVAYATSMSTHEFGKLLPGLKAIVKPVRDAAKNYRDVKIGRFFKSLFERESVTRASNRTWAEWFDKMLLDAVAKAKRATERGDTSAPNPEALKVACEALKHALVA
jgi:hypothetical protein